MRPAQLFSGVLVVIFAGQVLANGGPFVVKYPEGDPAAKGVLARIDPSLKPAREERLRVVREDLTLLFTKETELMHRSPANSELSRAIGQPPLVYVTAAYTIENPTDQRVEMDFGFPVLRGIYMHPYSMMPRPETSVRVDGKDVPVTIISNSAIYGMIRQRAADLIKRASEEDAELGRLVAQARCTSYLREKTRAHLQKTIGQDKVLADAARNDAVLGSVQAEAADSGKARSDAREALRRYMKDVKKWDDTGADLFVEYASLDLAGSSVHPKDAGFGWFSDQGLSQSTLANLGPLSAIGEQKATQLFAELAARFDPGARTAYEEIFSAWGGEVRERAVDFKSGALRPRELSLSDQARKEVGSSYVAGSMGDPTLYARVDYLDENAHLTPAEAESCQAILRKLPVVFTFAPMNLLYYRVTFPAHAAQTVTVSYRQYAFADTADPATYQLAYVVHPASLWKDFGPIRLTIGTPPGVPVRASVETEDAGEQERELPLTSRPPSSGKADRRRFSLREATLTTKTGELFVAVERAGWDKQGEPGRVAPAQIAPAAMAQEVPVPPQQKDARR